MCNLHVALINMMRINIQYIYLYSIVLVQRWFKCDIPLF